MKLHKVTLINQNYTKKKSDISIKSDNDAINTLNFPNCLGLLTSHKRNYCGV